MIKGIDFQRFQKNHSKMILLFGSLGVTFLDEVFPVLVMSTITRTYNISKSQKSKVANYGMPNVKHKLLKKI